MTERIFLALFVALMAALVVAIGYKTTQPSCEERGGHRVYSHTAMISNGKSLFPVRQYRCDVNQ